MYSQSLCEAKKQNSALVSRLQAIQAELSDCEMRRTQLEAQIQQTHNVGLLAFHLIRFCCKNIRSCLGFKQLIFEY